MTGKKMLGSAIKAAVTSRVSMEKAKAADSADPAKVLDSALAEKAKLKRQAEELKNKIFFSEYLGGLFILREDGYYFCDSDNDPNDEENPGLKICAPFSVDYLHRLVGTSGRWGCMISFTDMDGHRKEILLESTELERGSTLRAKLRAQGFPRPNPKGVRAGKDPFFECVNAVYEACSKRAYITEHNGWHDVEGKLGYVMKDKVIADDELDQPIRNIKDCPCLKYVGSQKGDLKGWQESVCRLALCSTRIVHALSAFGSAICLRFITHSESVAFHYVGNSSCGKSLTLFVAGSMAGYPDPLNSWNSRETGVEAVAAEGNDFAILKDEIGLAPDKKRIPSAIYTLHNGIGRVRGVPTGDYIAPVTFKNVTISTGELDLNGIGVETGVRITAGQRVRFPSIPADAGHGLQIFERLPDNVSNTREAIRLLEDAVKSNHGTAFEPLVRCFIKMLNEHGIESFNEHYQRWIAEFIEEVVPSEASPQIQRVAKFFAIPAVFGDLMSGGRNGFLTKYLPGICPGVTTVTGLQCKTDTLHGDAWEASKACFFDAVAMLGDMSKTDEDKDTIRLAKKVMLEEQKYFIDPECARDKLPNKVYGWCVHNRRTGERLFYMNENSFMDHIAGGRNLRDVTKCLCDAGLLKAVLQKKGNKYVRRYKLPRPRDLNRVVEDKYLYCLIDKAGEEDRAKADDRSEAEDRADAEDQNK